MATPRPLRLKDIATLKPCANCPFRSDVFPYLTTARVREIFEAAHRGLNFVCHKTVDYDLPRGALDAGRRMCAGFAIVLRREGRLSELQIVQVAERLAGLSFDGVKESVPVYASVSAMIRAHERIEGKRNERSKGTEAGNARDRAKPGQRQIGARKRQTKAGAGRDMARRDSGKKRLR